MLINFLIASCIIILMPGPSLILIIMNTIEGGIKQGLMSIMGVVIADAILLALISTGMGAIITSYPLIFTSLKWSGAIYLIYLGIAVIRSLNAQDEARSATLSTPFSSAINMTLLNPKIIVFLIAFFPQFIDPAKPIPEQMLLLSSIFLIEVFVISALIALGALTLRSQLQTPKGVYGVKILTAISLIGCGVMVL